MLYDTSIQPDGSVMVAGLKPREVLEFVISTQQIMPKGTLLHTEIQHDSACPLMDGTAKTLAGCLCEHVVLRLAVVELV